LKNKVIIRNVEIVNENQQFIGDISIEDSYISEVKRGSISGNYGQEFDGSGLLAIPGMIDDQVHFREPGLTHKANIYTESRAAVAGGITSFMEMPNTIPNTVTQKALEEKYKIGSESSIANYSFFMGANNENLDEVLKTNAKNVCGIKVFMGSSTGNMLVDNSETLSQIFKNSPLLIATHCEDEATIRKNTALYKGKYGDNIPFELHPIIRSEEACYLSSSLAVELAKKYESRLHILHISTAKELSLFSNKRQLKDKKITAECCIHHLWFNDTDYKKKKSFIKWNPAVKTELDRKSLITAINDDTVDVIATDHAPHTFKEKNNNYNNAPSGGPLVQHALLALLELEKRKEISLKQIVKKTSHDLAECFKINKRGYLRQGYFADIVLIDRNKSHRVDNSNILYKCGWSPFEGFNFSSSIHSTFINGQRAYHKGNFHNVGNGMRLNFDK
jgi:dihydroorotase